MDPPLSLIGSSYPNDRMVADIERISVRTDRPLSWRRFVFASIVMSEAVRETTDDLELSAYVEILEVRVQVGAGCKLGPFCEASMRLLKIQGYLIVYPAQPPQR